MIERIPFRLIRWRWEYQNADGSISAGWTATKRGARKEIAKAETDDFERTGPHASTTVRWV